MIGLNLGITNLIALGQKVKPAVFNLAGKVGDIAGLLGSISYLPAIFLLGGSIGPVAGVAGELSYTPPVFPAEIALAGTYSTSSGSFNQTVAIGAAAEDREVFVLIEVKVAAFSNPSISSITLGGVAMTPVVSQARQYSGDNRFYSGIYRLAVPSGTTANLTYSISASSGGMWVVRTQVLAAYNLEDPSTPIDTLTVNQAGAISGAALDTAEDGIALVACQGNGSSGSAATLSGIGNATTSYSAAPIYAAYGYDETTGATLSLGYAGPASQNGFIMVGASFR
jgi:hypothetical protein